MHEEIIQNLIQWFEKNGRTFLWRVHSDPYTVLMAEILLKKTTASVANRFLPLFLERYPDIRALHEESLPNLQELLTPLGLSNQRAKQLKSLATILVESYGEEVPCHRETLLNLPGIGDYVAGAILSFACNQPEPIVDTNVARVIIRLWRMEPSKCEARRSPEIWDKARQLINAKPQQTAKINWALLDLGALICKPRKPKCDECPLNKNCASVTLES